MQNAPHERLNYAPFFDSLRQTQLEPWLETLPAMVEQALLAHGNYDAWLDVLGQLPTLTPSVVELLTQVKVGTSAELTPTTLAQLETNLRRFHPWRKGPFDLYDIKIDTEWRSDWKWERLIEHIQPLAGRRVLDVGCGNGYHCWRMAAHRPKQVIGLDPTILYTFQFWVLRHLIQASHPVTVLPVGIEALPPKLGYFDTIFDMGVLYHRRSPFDHLFQLRHALRPSGELVLETLVIEGENGDVLVPEGRYAQMRNVWFIPSVPTLESWLRKCKFRHVRVVDVTTTSLDEQRTTDWMTFNSLPDFLDPHDPRLTREGHPAPKRAIILATAPQ
ncbi:MAG: tRNA 5-methoxyuridine(34)/uridine 5-oxyacetic acid(34) synthase CmoB [Candidatus Promineifilaceae bacterium]